MSQTNPAFEIKEINTSTGETTITIQRGILGALSNQLKNTSPRRKGSNILQKLGTILSECGDVQYGKDVEETNLPDTIMVVES